MGNAVAIVSSLGLSDLYKYVFNAMECRSACCQDLLVCDCQTKEIEVEKNDGDCGSLCCFDFDSDDLTSTSRGDDTNSSREE